MLPYYEHRTVDAFAFTSLDWHQEEPGWPLHLHHQSEIIYMVRGSADVIIDDRTERLSAGDLAVVFPHCIHRYKMVMDRDDPPELQGLMIAPHMAGDYGEHLSRKLPDEPFVRAGALGGEARFVLEQLFVHRRERHPAVTKAYLQLLFSLIWPQLQARTDGGRRQDDTLHRTIRYVMEHACQPLQAKEVAAAMGISGSHLARLFSHHLHMGFNDYVNQLRVQTAEDLLRSTDRSVTDIMSEVGFESQSTFNRAFRKVHGVSPREHRQRVRPHYLSDHPDD